MKILIIDNFDSFTQNIAQYLYEVTQTVPVIVQNTASFDELELDSFDAIVISPGPGHPKNRDDFGVCAEVIRRARQPILGICLGHQGIVQEMGGAVRHAPAPVHGYCSEILHTGEGLFQNLPRRFEAVRYHSLACEQLPASIKCTAWTEDGLVMAIAHKTKPLYGVQFHPESIASQHGHALLKNFVDLAALRLRQPATEPPAPADLAGLAIAWQELGGPLNMVLSWRPYPACASPEETFRHHFAADKHAFWLDSEGSAPGQARFSIMGSGSGPNAIRLSYVLAERKLSLEKAGESRSLRGDVFSLIRELQQTVHASAPSDFPCPFHGGLIGYFGYELKELAGGSLKHKSRYPDACFVFTPHFIVFDHQENTAYECLLTEAGRAPNWSAPLAPPPAAAARRQDPPPFRPGAVNLSSVRLADESRQYLHKIQQSLQYIADGESYEICLTNRASIPYRGDPLNAYRKMRHASPVPYGAYLACGGFSILSASPETFLKIDQAGGIESRPIKGTRPRGLTEEQDRQLHADLASSAKDKAENLMIVDLVRHDLNRICAPGSVHVPELFKIESYSSVHQLVSTIRGVLRADVSSVEAVRACFPGGSMTGAPKKRTMEIIDSLESSARGVYSGALGWLSFNGAAELSIVIRTATLDQELAEFGIGGAIVAHSDPQQELEETLVKASVPVYSFSDGETHEPC
ncbi:aminodeoxychorismate synthase, component I [Chromobacterium amazonense]|uniref:aminodeoxychorismate synthase n=1 Tax=Chromobacterium amazonense TaxID=1382803 RepID=A0A2S9X1M3_9NEIS|nr:aminodeoxychorismate synthase component I [Chromobacterium amazonense]PRP69615.1 aminodeoxychorismate synthase, component I [Chromobacterium amazonense]